jgi:hypothetical protein
MSRGRRYRTMRPTLTNGICCRPTLRQVVGISSEATSRRATSSGGKQRFLVPCYLSVFAVVHNANAASMEGPVTALSRLCLPLAWPIRGLAAIRVQPTSTSPRKWLRRPILDTSVHNSHGGHMKKFAPARTMTGLALVAALGAAISGCGGSGQDVSLGSSASPQALAAFRPDVTALSVSRNPSVQVSRRRARRDVD